MSTAVSRSLANPLRKLWADLGSKYKVYFNTHEDHGRKNTTYLAFAIYGVGGYLFYLNSKRKGRKVEAEKIRQKPNITKDALSRAGLA